jgi:hypothetical protein
MIFDINIYLRASKALLSSTLSYCSNAYEKKGYRYLRMDKIPVYYNRSSAFYDVIQAVAAKRRLKTTCMQN